MWRLCGGPWYPPPMGPGLEISDKAARVIGLAMAEMARVDGMHENEARVLADYMADLGGLPLDDHTPPDLASLSGPQETEALIKSVLLVANADGSFSPEESALLDRYCHTLGVAPATRDAWRQEVAGMMLQAFGGLDSLQDQVADLGRELGLDDAMIDRILGPPPPPPTANS